MLGAVVHPCPVPGDYHGTVYRGDQAVGEFALRVLEESSPMQVHIDLAGQSLHGDQPRNVAVDDCGCDDPAGGGGEATTKYTVGRDGYAVFHVSSGSGGYAVQLAATGRAGESHGREPNAGKPTDVWNSRELQKGDLFTATLLRPGTYSVAGPRGGEGKVRMMYPEQGKTAYRPPDPVRVNVTEQGFEPAGLELQPIQGLVFEIQAPARVTISLVEPEDRDEPDAPDEKRAARYSVRRRTAELRGRIGDTDQPNR
jgi:hypothetical protein